jgi:hypothetical protein
MIVFAQGHLFTNELALLGCAIVVIALIVVDVRTGIEPDDLITGARQAGRRSRWLRNGDAANQGEGHGGEHSDHVLVPSLIGDRLDGNLGVNDFLRVGYRLATKE